MATSLEELTAVDPDLLEKVAQAPLTAPDTTVSRSMQKAEARIKADDLTRRGIAFYTTPGGPKEITDPTGVPLVGFDKKNGIAWDSAGTAQKISFDPVSGEPQTAPAYDAAPVVTDKKGDVYKAPKGLPWQHAGEDPALKAELWQEEKDKLDAAADSALAPYQTQAAVRVRDSIRTAKRSKKESAEALATLGTMLTDDLGQPVVDLDATDAPTLRAHIEATYNKEYGSPAANATPLFGGGRLSSEAEALRKDIDQRKQRAFEIADAHVAALDEVKAARLEHGTIADQRNALRGERLDAINARREAAGLPAITLPTQQQGEGASISPHKADSAGATPASAPISTEPAKPPAAEGKAADTSFWSAFWSGIDQPLEAIGTTAQLFGVPGGTALRNLTNQPESYESAASRFIHPQEGDTKVPGLGVAPAYIPRALVEQFGQLGGSIISKVVGGLAGFLIGGGGGASVAGAGAAPGAATGALIGQFAGPFLFSALQIAGPTAIERAKNNGRTEPNASDIYWALQTASSSGWLDAAGDQFLPGGKKFVSGTIKRIASAFLAEGATEGTQSLIEQAGETGGTDKGLQVSLKQAAGEGFLGALAGGGVTAIGEALPSKRDTAEPPPLPTPTTSSSPAPVAGAPPGSEGPVAAVGGSGGQPPPASTTPATSTPPPIPPGLQGQGVGVSQSSDQQTADLSAAQGAIAPAPVPAGTPISAPAAGSEGGGIDTIERTLNGGLPPERIIVGSVDDAANEAATSPANGLPIPTEAQREAGNYKVGRAKLGGLDISIENPAGSKRKPEWPALKSHYGYIRGTEGKDGDHIDVFIRPGTALDYEGPVFVVNQVKKDGTFDEHKAVIGVANKAQAKIEYLSNYGKGWKGGGDIAHFPTMAAFKQWAQGASRRGAPAKSPSMPTPGLASPAVPPAAGAESAPSTASQGTAPPIPAPEPSAGSGTKLPVTNEGARASAQPTPAYNEREGIPEGAVSLEMETEARTRMDHAEIAPILAQMEAGGLGVSIVANRRDAAFTTTRKGTVINATRLAHALSALQTEEAKHAYVREALDEELKHQATLATHSKEDLMAIGQSLSADEIKAVNDLRGETMDDHQRGAEAIRIFMQAAEGKAPTEAFKLFTEKARTDGKFREAIRKVLDYIQELAAGISDGALSARLTDGIARTRAKLDEFEAAAKPKKETKPKPAPPVNPDAAPEPSATKSAPPKPAPPAPSSLSLSAEEQGASDFLDGLMAAEPAPASSAREGSLRTVHGPSIQGGGRLGGRAVEVSKANLKAVVVRKSALIKLLNCLES